MRLLVDVSPHGFGHLSQVAPVIDRLWRARPGLDVVVRTAVPRAQVAARLEAPFEYVEHAPDFGMEMRSALEVLPEPSFRRYSALHADWDRAIAERARELEGLAPDLLLANVPHLSLAAARAVGVPAAALCSLNWADVFWHYCRGFDGAEAIHAQMQAAYRDAELFIQPRPHMPMPWLDHAREVPPVATVGRNRRAELDERLGLDGAERLMLMAMGGMPFELPAAQWPRLPGVRWLFTGAEIHPDALPLERAGMGFGDLLASVDVVVTKPGYGTFVEAAAVGADVLYVSRGDWPEEPFLLDWMRRHARAVEMSREQLRRGDFQPALRALDALPRREPAAVGGEQAAAELLLRWL